MEEGLPLLAAQVGVGIAEDKTDGGKEVALSGAVAADDYIGSRGEGLDDGLVLIAVGGGGVSARTPQRSTD
jgi:hypothetical protein